MKNKQSKPLFWTFAMICSIALIGFGSGSALADDVDSDGNPIVTPAEPEELSGGTVSNEEGESPVEFEESFGSKTQATWIGAHQFSPYSSSEGWSRASSAHIYSTSGTGIFCAPVRLPSGALVTKVEYYYYDAYPSFNVRMQFWRAKSQNSQTAFFNYIPPFLWSPGFRTGSWTPIGGFRIANGQGWYYVCFDLASAAGSSHRFWGVRILWERDQGPAGGQIFSDVPPFHTFYQSINNLARSGISEGFLDGTYRPNQFVTRGQMAAFLARALGLYWAYPTY